MTKEELWNTILAKNPRFDEAARLQKIISDKVTVTLSIEGFKRIIDLAFDKGHDLGVANGRALAEREAKAKPQGGGSLFDNLFGRM